MKARLSVIVRNTLHKLNHKIIVPYFDLLFYLEFFSDVDHEVLSSTGSISILIPSTLFSNLESELVGEYHLPSGF